MKLGNVLILYKKSAYKIYFLEKNSSWFDAQVRFPRYEIKKFERAHNVHYATLALVEEILYGHGIHYQKYTRGRKLNYDEFDSVITVGGDGTFLEAARGLKRQFILGVNSDPSHSIGRFCTANAKTFKNIIEMVIEGKCEIKCLPRIRLTLSHAQKNIEVNILNDVLICHENPAAMSRYALKIDDITEEQRSSGLWIATAAGSSGAMRSAGGSLISPLRKEIQYRPRELYQSPHRQYRLTGRVLNLKRPMVITSLMRSGVIFVDGAHVKFPFPFGRKARIFHSPEPVRMVEVEP